MGSSKDDSVWVWTVLGPQKHILDRKINPPQYRADKLYHPVGLKGTIHDVRYSKLGYFVVHTSDHEQDYIELIPVPGHQ